MHDNLSEEIINKRLELLKKINIFSHIQGEQILNKIAGILLEYTLAPDEPVFSKGDPSSSLYIIESGCVIVHEGEHIFNVFITGDIFGEYALLDDESRSASVTSVTKVTLLKLNKIILEDYFDLKTEIIRALAKVLTARLRLYNQMESKLTESHNNIKKQHEEIQIQKEKIQAQAEHLELVNQELEKLSIVASETKNAITIMDESGNYLWVNDGFIKMYGFNLEQLILFKGKNIFDGPEAKYLTDILDGKKIIDKSVNYEVFTHTKFGDKFWVNTTLTPVFNKQGKLLKIVSIDSNINDIKLAEAEIRQQKEEIEAQNDRLNEVNNELHTKNVQVTDSINYAKRIQSAILPNEKSFRNYFADFFILYKPKNIVSGDFFWTRTIEDEQSGKSTFALAVADCTGHGVPGAFMSLLGMTMLNELSGNLHIYENENIQPNDVLFKLRKKIIYSLKQTGKLGEQKDGMDMSFCIFNTEQLTFINNQFAEMQFAGANNSIFIVRHGSNGLVVNSEMAEPILSTEDNASYLYEIKADRMPIGIYQRGEEPFKNNNILIQKGDIIYMFTDGYCDQEGGDSEQKFLKSRFKKLILEISKKTLSEQQEIFEQKLIYWKTSCSQTDDITILGIKI